ncbi:putative triose-phosphate Transporter family protein [Lyophyllum shimeji]|uniref:Triose-phosphate Transporter family protein n=1 Tax=Lyophyllum shimeji TaxID=47721 RepID=A0A9P3PHF2_LYOSH|nr:putative triose-phosphate Transporter family protein [Lyophyllum shimeji]
MLGCNVAGTLQVAAVVAFYMAAALIMVFVNKAVLNSSPDLPLLFLLIQLLIAVILLYASALVSKRIEIPKFDAQTAKKLVPVVLVNVIGLVFNTLCLRDVEASFFQIARGLVLPLTIVVSSLHTRTTPPAKVLLAAATVAFGFFVGVTPSTSLPVASTPSIISLLYGVLSSLFIAFHAVLIKSSLPHCNNSTIQLAWWTNCGSAVVLFPAVVLDGEAALFSNMLHDAKWDGTVFFRGSLVTGFFGFLLCIAGLLSIKITSPITHMFSSAARSVLQTLLGRWIFGDILTVSRGASITIILGGTMYYTWIKSQTSPPPSRRSEDVESSGADSMSLKSKHELAQAKSTPPVHSQEK